MSWALGQETGSPTRKLVLMLICDLADEQLTCYPGRKRLARDAELSEGTVSRTVTDLVAGGFLRVLRRARKRGGRSTNRYLVMMYGDDTPLPDVDDWVSEFTGDAGETAGDGNGDADAPLVDGDDEPAGDGNGDTGAPLPGGGNGDADAHSNVTDAHVSNKEDLDPLGVNKENYSPPTVTHGPDQLRSAAAIAEARAVMRRACEGVDALRLPNAAERGSLVEQVVAMLDAGWAAEQLAARLTGMGSLATAASPYAVLMHRLRQVGPPPPPPAAAPSVGPWCRSAECDKTTRRLVDDEGRPRFAYQNGHRVALWCECSGREG